MDETLMKKRILIYTNDVVHQVARGAEAKLRAAGIPWTTLPIPIGKKAIEIPEGLLSNVGGILFNGVALLANVPEDAIRAWIQKHPEIPSLITAREVEGCASITGDFEDAVTRICEHLRIRHGVNTPVFFGGPKDNQAAGKRLKGFIKAAETFGWKTEGRIFHGDFTFEGGARMARELLDSKIDCDAVVCSSDWQVPGLRQVFQDHGRRPPPHSGFDNHHQVIKTASDLTTLDYQDGLLGWHGVGELMRMGEGAKSLKPFSTRIRLPLVIRCSCGCPDEAVDPIWPEEAVSFLFPEPEKNAVLRDLMSHWNPLASELDERWKRFIEEERRSGPETLRLRSFLSECFSGRGALRPGRLDDALRDVEDREEFLREQTRTAQSYLLARFVPRLGQGGGLENMHEALGDLLGALNVAHWELETDVEKRDQIGKAFSAEEVEHSSVLPLFWNGEWVGCLSVSPGKKLETIGTWLRYFLASQIAASQALRKEREARLRLHDAISLLEQNNLKLVELSERDPLTGLYNRRGFSSRAEVLWQRARESHRPCMLIFADLDGLKQINDIHGHEAGDVAIAAAGQCLAQCLRKTDLLCRMGGDEFTGMLLGVDERSLKVIGRRLERITEAWNSAKPHPWKLAVSLGGRARPTEGDLTFAAHLALADESLYEMKKKRKALARGSESGQASPGVK